MSELSIEKQEEPLVEFFSLFRDAPPPRRADRSLLGSIPLRAYQHCEPLTAASGFGWYLYPPIEFVLKWSGAEILWRTIGSNDWEPTTNVVLPGYEEIYAQSVPQNSTLNTPFPFLLARREIGHIQIWPGIIVRTQPGWSTLVRGPANLPQSNAYQVLEGIIETDWWFGPLISTIRLCQTDCPIYFRPDRPIFQLQPVQTKLYKSKTLDDFRLVEGLSSLSDADWRRLEATIRPYETRAGTYAAKARRTHEG
jgi:uncharacterized protein DUF6065